MVDFHCHHVFYVLTCVTFAFAFKIEAMYERSHVNVKVEPRSTSRLRSQHFISCLYLTPLLRELNWLPVKEQLFYRDSVLTFKCQNDLAPQYLTSKFTKRSNIHTRNTRTRNSLQIPLYRTAIGQRTFSYRGAYIWNNLHNELRQSASLASFKRALKDILLS